jgi:hypothetical protein
MILQFWVNSTRNYRPWELRLAWLICMQILNFEVKNQG